MSVLVRTVRQCVATMQKLRKSLQHLVSGQASALYETFHQQTAITEGNLHTPLHTVYALMVSICLQSVFKESD